MCQPFRSNIYNTRNELIENTSDWSHRSGRRTDAQPRDRRLDEVNGHRMRTSVAGVERC